MPMLNRDPKEIKELMDRLMGEVDECITNFLFEMCGNLIDEDTDDDDRYNELMGLSYEVLRREVKKRL